ncbi:hypothetical protein BKA70DRAFT_1046415, partial [Coprinopsis sp. MPI-PUGE-AT-0042]
PCGFCGLDGCATQLIKAGKTGKPSFSIKSQCQYRYTRLQYKNTSTFNPAKPTCTNVPIHCPLCPRAISGHPRTIWKYNAVMHLLTNH